MEDTLTTAENNELGQIRIDEEVVTVIAYLSINDFQDIYHADSGVSKGFGGVLSKKNYTKGIKVNLQEDIVSIDVNLDVKFGAVIPDLCKSIQETIKETVENMTGFSVSSVNVFIQRVRFPGENK